MDLHAGLSSRLAKEVAKEVEKINVGKGEKEKTIGEISRKEKIKVGKEKAKVGKEIKENL